MKINKNKKGSVVVAVLLILMMIAVISISVIERSLVSLDVSMETRESNEAYQEVDALAESFLAMLRKMEVEEDTKIEDIEVADICNCLEDATDPKCVNFIEAGNNEFINSPNNFCEKNNIIVYDKDSDEVAAGDVEPFLVKDLSKIKISSATQDSVERSISVNLPQRLPPPLVNIDQEGMAPVDCAATPADCPTNYATQCGSSCYKIYFLYITDHIKEDDDSERDIKGVNIIKDASGTRTTFSFEDVSENESDQFNDLICDDTSGVCYFYIGNIKLNGTPGNISFRVISNSNFFLDSLDYTFDDPFFD